MFNWIKKLKEDWNSPMPIDPIQTGKTVIYLGVEWTVTQRVFCDSQFNHFEISRINPLGQIEEISLPYYTTLVRLKTP